MGAHSVTPVRWGIIGAGRIAETFAHDIQFTEQAELVAIASTSESRAETFARRFGLSTFYADYEALLSNPDIDAVYIATPHSQRWSYFFRQVSGKVKLQIVGLCYAANTVFCSFGCRV